jgi:hypothetical protein
MFAHSPLYKNMLNNVSQCMEQTYHSTSLVIQHILFTCCRWCRVMKRNNMYVNNIPCVIAAACILHIMREVHSETFSRMWLQDLNLSSAFSQPPTSSCVGSTSQSATHVRNVLVHYVTCRLPRQTTNDISRFVAYLFIGWEKYSNIFCHCMYIHTVTPMHKFFTHRKRERLHPSKIV